MQGGIGSGTKPAQRGGFVPVCGSKVTSVGALTG